MDAVGGVRTAVAWDGLMDMASMLPELALSCPLAGVRNSRLRKLPVANRTAFEFNGLTQRDN